ncbi:hypothetical protein CES94_28540 (plasmid) [Escherichia coli]|nr:hypothetical protein CES94_28540 [Escherichia coli]AUY99014.1 hypothetical protein BWI87_25530 [Escherichia coli]
MKMPAFEWVHVQLHQQKGMISLSPPTICNSAEKTTRTPIPVTNSTQDSQLHNGLKKTLHDALTAKIQLTSFEAKFLSDMQSKHDLNDSFTWLTQKQRATLEKILAKYGRF